MPAWLSEQAAVSADKMVKESAITNHAVLIRWIQQLRRIGEGV